MGSESTAWLFDNYRGGKILVVSVCSKDPVQLGQIKDYERGSGNFAFTSLNVPVEVQMAYVKELRPDLKNLAVLVDSKNVSAVQTQAEPIASFARQTGIQVIWGAVQNPSKAREELVPIVQSAVQTMRKSDPDLSKSLFWMTGSTSVFLEIRTVNEHADRVPVVSVVPEIVKAGPDTAVLAIGVSFESNAHLAAIYGAQILAGRAKAGDLKVGLVSPPDIAISFMKRAKSACASPSISTKAPASSMTMKGVRRARRRARFCRRRKIDSVRDLGPLLRAGVATSIGSVSRVLGFCEFRSRSTGIKCSRLRSIKRTHTGSAAPMMDRVRIDRNARLRGDAVTRRTLLTGAAAGAVIAAGGNAFAKQTGDCDRLRSVLIGHRSIVSSAAFSPDARQIVTASYDTGATMECGDRRRIERAERPHRCGLFGLLQSRREENRDGVDRRHRSVVGRARRQRQSPAGGP